MNLRSFLVGFLFGVLGAISGLYGQITSTLQGGPWSAPSTWQGGVEPGPADDVVIIGPVQLDAGGNYFVHSLTVETTGQLTAVTNVPASHMHVTADVVNHGEITGKSNLTPLYFTIGGGLINTGQWRTLDVTFTDSTTHLLRAEPGSFFTPQAIFALRAVLSSDRDAFLQGVHLVARKLILNRDFATNQPTTFFFLNQSMLELDSLEANNNAVAGDSSSYLNARQSSTGIDCFDLHIRGFTQLKSSINNFYGTLTVEDTLLPHSSNTFPRLFLFGDVVNNGTLSLSTSGLGFQATTWGNVTNNGAWETENLIFNAAIPQTLSTDLNSVFKAGLLRNNNTLLSGSSLRLDGVEAHVHRLVLLPGHDLFLKLGCQLNVDTLLAGGNRLEFQDNSYLNTNLSGFNPVIDQAVLSGTILVKRAAVFTGQTRNEGDLMPHPAYSGFPLEIEGPFTNQGAVLPNGNVQFGFLVRSDLVNNGLWQSQWVRLEGKQTQRVAIPDSTQFSTDFQIKSDRTGLTYQWEKNGMALVNGGHISGATSNILHLSKVGPSDYGTYRCRIDSSGQTIFSREVVIADVVTGLASQASSEALPKTFRLGQNFPNPFNPTTTIPYALPRAVKVQLILYDALGREVAVLVDRVQPAGRYRVRLNGENLAAGLYFYRLKAGDFVQMKKLVLIK